MVTVNRRRRRGALRLGVAATLGLAPQVADPGAWSGLLRGARRAVGARSLSQGLATDVDGAFLLLAENALWLTRQGARTRLASGTGGWLQDPAWSPDGSQVSYTHFRFGAPSGAPSGSSAGGPPGGIPWPSGEVYALRPDAPGAAPRPLVRREAPYEALVSASWAPDGGALYAVRRRPLGPTTVRGDLVRCDLQTGAVAELSVPFEAIEVSAGPASELGGAPPGTLAVVGVTGPAVTGLPDLALVLLGTDGTLRQVASTAVERGDGASPPALGFLSLPRFSPDGRRLAFAAGDGAPSGAPPGTPGESGAGSAGGGFLRAVGLRQIAAHGLRGWPWVADLETGTLRQIPTGGHDDLAGIAWLPDGERLLILDVSGLAVVDVASASLTRIPEATAGLAATALAYAPAPGRAG